MRTVTGFTKPNHGCAYDLAGKDTANPAGQILSLAMLLCESFGFDEAANRIEAALASAWRQGWRTAELAEPHCRLLGGTALAARVARQVLRSAKTKQTA